MSTTIKICIIAGTIIITLALLTAVSARNFLGREVIKLFSACANDTLKNIVPSGDCKYEVWEIKMKDGPRKNVQIRYYALENNSCMALSIGDKNSNVSIVRVVAKAFLMPHSAARCYYNHRVTLNYDNKNISMTLHEYGGDRPDEYVHTFKEDEMVPSEIRISFSCMKWFIPRNFKDDKEEDLIYKCDKVADWKRKKLYHGIMYLFAVDLLGKKQVEEKNKRILMTTTQGFLNGSTTNSTAVTQRSTISPTFVFTKMLIGNVMVIATTLSVFDLLYSFLLFLYVWCKL